MQPRKRVFPARSERAELSGSRGSSARAVRRRASGRSRGRSTFSRFQWLVALNLSHGVQVGRTSGRSASTLTPAIVAVIIAAVANRSLVKSTSRRHWKSHCDMVTLPRDTLLSPGSRKNDARRAHRSAAIMRVQGA